MKGREGGITKYIKHPNFSLNQPKTPRALDKNQSRTLNSWFTDLHSCIHERTNGNYFIYYFNQTALSRVDDVKQWARL